MSTNLIAILLLLAALFFFALGFFNVPINHPGYVGLGLMTLAFIVERVNWSGNRQP